MKINFKKAILSGLPKTIIIFFSIFMFVSFAYAKKSTIEDEIVKNGGVVISDPNFDGDYFLANSAAERYVHEGEDSELEKIQKDRATNICRMLGYGPAIIATIGLMDKAGVAITVDTSGNATGIVQTKHPKAGPARWRGDHIVNSYTYITWSVFTKIACKSKQD